MTTILLTNRLTATKAHLGRFPGNFRYLNLTETRESFGIGKYLQKRNAATEIPRVELFQSHGNRFRTKFIEFLGRLNLENHSLYWWAMPFTDKFPLGSAMYQNAFYFFIIAALFHQNRDPLVVVTDSANLSEQVKSWGKKEGIEVIDAVYTPHLFRRLIKKHTPAGIIYASFRAFLYRLMSHRLRPRRNTKDNHLVITTLTHPRSYLDTPPYYRDAYFGDLVEEAARSESKVAVFSLVVGRPIDQLKKLNSLRFKVPIIPNDSSITIASLLACTLRALKLYAVPPKLKGAVDIDGLDLSCLVNRELLEGCHSGNLFFNLRLYYSARDLARRIRITRCLYPYENLARDKMLVLGIRSASPTTHLVGYQHAAVSPLNTNFMLAPEESSILPLPDVILTTGDVTKELLRDEGNYPDGLIKSACALRQMDFGKGGRDGRIKKVNNVFVALGSIWEYESMLVFLDKAFVQFTGTNKYELRIRPHPERALNSAIETAPLSRQGFFSESVKTLDEEFRWADLVIYSSSTVALEAIATGLPAICINLGNYVETDPLSGWDAFKWSVNKPSELIPAIQSIESLTDNEYQDRLLKGQAYSSRYLAPVTPERLRIFLEA